MKLLAFLVLLIPAFVQGAHLIDLMPDLDEMLACKHEGDICHGVPNCCDDLVCYWEDKWNPFAVAHCVECVAQGERCQVDAQCCEGFQCDTDVVVDINGRCQPARPEGNICHRDAMCEGYCDKRWYQLYGYCAPGERPALFF